MSRITQEQLDYKFRRVVTEKLRPRRLKEFQHLVDDIVWDLMDEVPVGAFEEVLAHQKGLLFYHGRVSRSRCEGMQHDLMSMHLTLPADAPIKMFLSSPGGIIMYGLGVMGVIHQIQREGRSVNVHVSGQAESMGSVITQAGTHRSMDSSALLMLHESSYGISYGKLREHQDLLKGSLKEWDCLCDIYAERTGKPSSYWRDKLERRDIWFTAQECLAEGLIDEIIESPFAKQKVVEP